MASIGFLIGGALVNALAFTGSNYLFSSLSNSKEKLDLPFRQSCPGQKTISYLGPNIWNNLAAETKLRRSVNSFKHDIKKLFFNKLKKQNDDIFFYY